MALTGDQKSSRLFKKSLGVAETITTKEFFNEAKLGNYAVLPNQIWAQSDQIPYAAPSSLIDGQTLGVVKRRILLPLTFISGSVSGGRDVSYFGTDLIDAIPSNFNSGGSYYISLWKSDGTTPINDGEGDWLVDPTAGVLTFYGTPPTGVASGTPPKISFYKYVGTKGLVSSGITGDVASLSTALSTEISDRSSVDGSLSISITGNTSNITSLSTAVVSSVDSLSATVSTSLSTLISTDTVLSTSISIETSTRTSESYTYLKLTGGTMTGTIDMTGHQIIVNVDPVSQYDLANKKYVDAIAQGVAIHAPVHVVATVPITLSGSPQTIDGHSVISGEFVLATAQGTSVTDPNSKYNGIYVVSGGTWLRRSDADGLPSNEIELGDFVFVQSGATQTNTGWAIGDTNAPSGQTYISTGDTQMWFKMAAPGTYTTDGEGLELTGGTFYLELNGGTLYKDASGLKVSDSLSTVISSNTTSLSTEISTRDSADIVLSTAISTVSGTTTNNVSSIVSLSTAISTNTSAIAVISGATGSLSTAVSTLGSTDSSLSVSITGNTSNITSLSTTLSTQISTLTSTDTVLSIVITGITSNITSLSTAVSTLSSTDTSLSIALTGSTSNITSLSTAISSLASTDSSLSISITGLTTSLNSLSTVVSTSVSTLTSTDTVLSTAISVEKSDRTSTDASLSISITGNTSNVTSLSTVVSTSVSTLTSTDTVLSSAISTETSDRKSGDTSLSIAIYNVVSGNTYDDSSLSTRISTEESVRGSADSSLSTSISSIVAATGATASLSTVVSTSVSTLTSTDTVLSTAISTAVSTSTSTDTVLSSSISTEKSDRISADTSIVVVIGNLSGVTAQTAGSGLTYNALEKALNVNVDNWTIKISGDTLIGAQQWLQYSTTSNVIGTSGYTTLSLAYDPITPVSAYVNGIEYLINTGVASASNRPFYYSVYPPVKTTQIGFNPVEAGFSLETGIDMVLIKYLIVENLMQ